VKQENKNKLAAFILEQTGIQINPNSLFDVQAKTTSRIKTMFCIQGNNSCILHAGEADSRVQTTADEYPARDSAV
jgi:hypothetical protein